MDLPIVAEKVIFSNDKGFTILACSLNPYSSKYKPELEDILLKNIKPNSYHNFCVTIDMMTANEKVEGVQYICIGEFHKHPKFGDQFKAEYMFPDEPTNEDGLRAYLCTLPNIKESRSKMIIKKFGFQGAVDILDNNIMKLTEIPGITESRIPPIKEAWDRNKGERELCMWLHNHGVQPKEGKKIYSIWKQESLKILTKNPYRLTEIKGFGFIRADQIAHKIMDVVPKDFRTTACLRHVLDEALYKESNLCIPYGTLRDRTVKLLQDGSEQNAPNTPFNINEYKNSLIPKSIKGNLDIFVAIKNIQDPEPNSYIYLKTIWNKEKYIAKQLYSRKKGESEAKEESDNNNRENDTTQFFCSDKDIEDAEKDVGEFSFRKITLDDCQKSAIKSVFENKVTVITGGGGSGKSTICRCIFHLAQEKGLLVRMMSPTGKAAQVLSNKTGFEAHTIHRSLKIKIGEDQPQEVIREDVIIIDEVSMVGIDTMYAIMYAMKENIWGHIVFVGDCNQLPSVSPGNFLSDILKSQCVNIVRLDKIHRQDENSFIPLLANDISMGKVVTIPSNATDIKWNNLTSYDAWGITLKSIIKEFISNYNIDDLQIIAPMYRGSYGINRANEIVQDFMAEENGVKEEPFQRGFTVFYVGDRVLQTENDYGKSIFNGDMGTITEAGRKVIDPNSDEVKDFVVVNFYGEDKIYIGEEIEQLRLGWCCSIHKFQGSQSPYVILILSNEAPKMLTKELLYTGMTRAAKRLDLYGHMDAFRTAPTKSAVRMRYTNMNNMIKELKDNQKIFKILE